MPWNLEKNEISEFARNPLSAVVGQLRFHAILKIGHAQDIGAFQDLVRHRFPEYSEDEHRVVRIRPDGVETRNERRFHFSTADNSTTISLGTTTLALESREHRSHEHFVNDFALAAFALDETYGSISTTRLGLRYINLIKRDKIGKDLQREVDWSDLIADEFLHVPSAIDDLKDTTFSNEVTSSIKDGKLTLRYGLLLGEEEKNPHYRFDLDRYFEGEVDLSKVDDVLRGYAEDIYNLFLKVPGPALFEWLGPSKN